MTIARVARAAGLTAAVAGTLVAAPQAALAAPSTTQSAGQTVGQATSTSDASIQFCREVTALTLTVWTSSSGNDTEAVLERGDQVDVIGGPTNGRYHVNYKEDGRNEDGWISSSSQWIGPCD